MQIAQVNPTHHRYTNYKLRRKEELSMETIHTHKEQNPKVATYVAWLRSVLKNQGKEGKNIKNVMINDVDSQLKGIPAKKKPGAKR